MTPSYRPQPMWLLMGPLLGAFAGAVVATVLVWGVALTQAPTSPSDLADGVLIGLVLGGIYGGLVGAGVGLVVGLPLVFLVGRHLTREVARRRAHVLGAVLPPLTLVVGVVLASDDPDLSPGVVHLVMLLPLAGAAFMGSRLAGWLAGKDDAVRPVS